MSGGDTTNFSTGAQRSSDANHLRFDLISPIAKIALARVYGEGVYKYGELNMELGMPLHDLYNHVDRHLTMYFAGDRSEPHLEHALWGVGMMIHSAELWPELNEPHLRDQGCVLSEAQKKALADNREAVAERRRNHPEPPWSMGDIPEIRRLRDQRTPAAAPKAPETDELYVVQVPHEASYRGGDQAYLTKEGVRVVIDKGYVLGHVTEDKTDAAWLSKYDAHYLIENYVRFDKDSFKVVPVQDKESAA